MRRPAISLPTALLAASALLLAGCGGGAWYHDDFHGSVEVDNLSAEFVLGFYMAPAATGLYTGNLLGGPLPPGFVEYVGEFEEDLYDAEADLEFGDLVTWFDVFVPAGDTTVFEVF